jgi:leader peptidase (prepilin peptidase)/N-methyltransferase
MSSHQDSILGRVHLKSRKLLLQFRATPDDPPVWAVLALLALAVPATLYMTVGLSVAGCLLGWALLALAAIDIAHFILPDALTLPLIAAGLTLTIPDLAQLQSHALGAAIGFLAFAGINLAYRALRGRDGLGLGDAKLLAAAGAWLGWPALPPVVLLAALTALVWIGLAALRGKKAELTTRVPFGPFLALGFWISWLAT